MLGESRRSEGIEQRLPIVSSTTEADGSLVGRAQHPRLILAGYSYGSMIASHLPSIDRVMELFKRTTKVSAEREIQLRACYLSSQTMKGVKSSQDLKHDRAGVRVPAPHSNLGSSNFVSSVSVGGFESEAAEQRIDRESSRSWDVRKSLDRVRDKIHSRPQGLVNSIVDGDDAVQAGLDCNLITPQICYLLISPLLSPVSTLATFFSPLSFEGRVLKKNMLQHDTAHPLVQCPSLAVYGTKDLFTSIRKLRRWAQELGQISSSTFQSREVDGAGHFWYEAGVLEEMEKHIREWECSL